MKDYYKILEVEPSATLEQIKSQHRFLIHAWHPDKFPSADLKTKAEEKVKAINEAYDVLGNHLKREKYDKVFSSESQSPSSTQQHTPAKPKTPKVRRQVRPKQHCQNCGLPAKTKYVEFYENIGMLFSRQHRSAKGNLCKPCINYYFWNMTGKTMILGWWGTVSFIVTPFILLNNLFRFIFAASVKKPSFQITPNPSPFWVFSTISGFILVSFFFFSLFSPTSAQPEYFPSPTTAPVPTRVPTRVKTPTVPASNCILWSKVSPTMIGKTTCVYGNVYKTKFVGQNTYQLLFSSDPSSFFLATGTYYYEVGSGECVVAEGEILRSGSGVPYINIDEALYECEAWMK